MPVQESHSKTPQQFIYLIRHGQSTANRDYIIQGHYDAPLTELGEEQALLTSRFFENKKEEIKNLYSSDLQRAMQTMAPIAELLSLESQIDKNLREAFFGKWEGKASQEISDKEPDLYSRWRLSKTWRPEWCESYQELQSRGITFINQILDKEGDSIIVSHGGLINALIDHYEQKSLSECSSIALDNCSITTLEVVSAENQQLKVVSTNVLAPHVPLTRFRLAGSA